MSVEQVAMTMWAGYCMATLVGSEESIARACKEGWMNMLPMNRAEWRTRARTYLRAIGRIK